MPSPRAGASIGYPMDPASLTINASLSGEAGEHRLVYKIVDDEIRIAACRYHYER